MSDDCDLNPLAYPMAVSVREIAEVILARLQIHGRCSTCSRMIDGEDEGRTLHPRLDLDAGDTIEFNCIRCGGIPEHRRPHFAPDYDEAAGRG